MIARFGAALSVCLRLVLMLGNRADTSALRVAAVQFRRTSYFELRGIEWPSPLVHMRRSAHCPPYFQRESSRWIASKKNMGRTRNNPALHLACAGVALVACIERTAESDLIEKRRSKSFPGMTWQRMVEEWQTGRLPATSTVKGDTSPMAGQAVWACVRW